MQFNEKLVAEKRPYLLIGVGRWGSLDPWLGIPVKWDQISGAKVIVEAGFKDMEVDPSQGSHFFHNITSFRISYFTVNSTTQDGFVDWEWLRTNPSRRRKTLRAPYPHGKADRGESRWTSKQRHHFETGVGLGRQQRRHKNVFRKLARSPMPARIAVTN